MKHILQPLLSATLGTAILLSIVLPASAQRVVVGADGTTTTYPAGVLVIETTSSEGPLEPIVYDPGEIANFIVVFAAPPLAIARTEAAGKQSEIALAEAAVSRDHERFRQDLGRLSSSASKRAGGGESQIQRSFREVLNGVSVSARRDVAREIRALPYVAGVYDDHEMRVSDESSNRVIGADRARSELGATGQGVVVAIIDTGIDYMHPGLGGGLGAGYRVIGGYDFIDDDDDPMDGHGHGTHVAGIVAANDGASFLGVAPNARLLGYRVLNNNGSGASSGVIAGIERAVIDGAHVINLSLGGSGHADDPTSQAVDNATAAGVLCVVAAGNDGRSFSINSPGSARTALTVGASDNEDALATFSSRGPTSFGFENKPDVVAPGVSINSTVLSGQFAAYSGTSMSTPHVAGAAALLIERHPSWNPHDLKSALTHTAVDAGLHIWQQGAGRIDIMAADAARASVSPTSLSFGNLDPSSNLVNFSRTLTVRNLSGSTQNWSFTSTHSIAGAAVTITPSTINLSAGAAGSVTVTTRFEPQKLAFPLQIDVPYVGAINAVTAEASIRIPFSVTKTPQLTIDFDEPPVTIDIIGSEGGVARTYNPGTVVDIPLGSGTYDVIMLYPEEGESAPRFAFAVREGVQVSGKHALSVRKSEIRNELRLAPLGRSGQPLDVDYGYLSVERRATANSSFFTYSGYLEGDPTIAVSDLSSRFKIEALLLNLGDENRDKHVVPFTISGLTGSTTLQNNPASFRSITTTYETPADVTELFLMPHQIRRSGEQITTISPEYFITRADRYRLTPPFVRTVHYGARPAPDFGYRYFAHQAHNTSGGVLPKFLFEETNLLYTSPIVEAAPSQTHVYAYRDFDAPLRSVGSTETTELFGAPPLMYTGRMWNIGPTSTVRFDIRRAGFFVGTAGEIVEGSSRYRLATHEGTVVSEGETKNSAFIWPFWAEAGAYELDLDFAGGYLEERPIAARVRLAFDTRHGDGIYDPDPPMIDALYLTTSNERVTAFEGNGQHAVVAFVRDTYNQGGPTLRAVAEAEFAIRRLGETDWTVVPAARHVDRFTANLASELSAGYYDLRISARDLQDNTLDYQVAPGFRLGSVASNNPPAAARLESPSDHAFLRLHEFSGPLTFSWAEASDPDEGQLVRYVFRLTGPGLDTTITTSDTEVAFGDASFLIEGGDYSWWVDTSDGFALTSSEVYTLKVRGETVSIDPVAGELPRVLDLAPNYPNPFNPSTTFVFSIPEHASVRIDVFDMTGRQVDTVVNESMAPGRYERSWDASHQSSGVYLVRLTTGAESRTQRVVLLK
jgi:subtilisin family serine protease